VFFPSLGWEGCPCVSWRIPSSISDGIPTKKKVISGGTATRLWLHVCEAMMFGRLGWVYSFMCMFWSLYVCKRLVISWRLSLYDLSDSSYYTWAYMLPLRKILSWFKGGSHCLSVFSFTLVILQLIAVSQIWVSI
jgi:hypothetical protein